MKQFLLDTHVLLWMQDDSPYLSETVRDILTNPDNDLYVSIASFWEIVIKRSLGKLELEYTIKDLVQSCAINNIIILPVQFSFLEHLETLPFIHRDPFDRLIAATVIDLNYGLLSKDPNLHLYDLQVYW